MPFDIRGFLSSDLARFIASLVALALPIVAVLILRRHEKSRLARSSNEGPVCEQCGYLLIGLTSNRCPECGASTAMESIDSLIDR